MYSLRGGGIFNSESEFGDSLFCGATVGGGSAPKDQLPLGHAAAKAASTIEQRTIGHAGQSGRAPSTRTSWQPWPVSGLPWEGVVDLAGDALVELEDFAVELTDIFIRLLETEEAAMHQHAQRLKDPLGVGPADGQRGGIRVAH